MAVNYISGSLSVWANLSSIGMGWEDGLFADRSLLCGAYHCEHAALHRSQPDRLNCCVGWRTIPGVCLFGVVECDNHNSHWRSVAVKAFYLAAGNDKMIMALERRQRFLHL